MTTGGITFELMEILEDDGLDVVAGGGKKRDPVLYCTGYHI